MLQSDIFLNILKYLDVYQWIKYINLNKKMRGNLLKKIGLIKKYFRENKYSKLLILDQYREYGTYEQSRLLHIILRREECDIYCDLYRKKFGRILNLEKDSLGLFHFRYWDKFFDDEIYLELYRIYKHKGKTLSYLNYEGYTMGEVPYEYYINGCYKIKKEEDEGRTCEVLELQSNKLGLICKVRFLEREIKLLKEKVNHLEREKN